jgi:predicted RNA binding protein YcfA (HicA-like mRNA interferase family)
VKGVGGMGKSYSSSKIIKLLKKNGWFLDKVTGDHHQFKHPAKKGKVTVPHPKKDLNISVLASIKRQSGLKI